MKEKYISTYIDTSGESKLFSEMYKTILFANPSVYCFICKIHKVNYEVVPFGWLKHKLPYKKYPSLDEAKSELNELLLNEGYVFLTQEQWDKLSILI